MGAGGIISVALAVDSRRPGVTWHLNPVEPGLSSMAGKPATATVRSTPAKSNCRFHESIMQDKLYLANNFPQDPVIVLE